MKIASDVKRLVSLAITFACLVIFVVFSGCAQVPVTQRKGLHLLSDSQLLSLSVQQYEEVLKNSKLSKDQKAVQMVNGSVRG